MFFLRNFQVCALLTCMTILTASPMAQGQTTQGTRAKRFMATQQKAFKIAPATTGPSSNNWLDNSKGRQRKLVIPSGTLRSHTKWRRFKSPTPSPVIKPVELEGGRGWDNIGARPPSPVIKRFELERRIESIKGGRGRDQIRSSGSR